MPDPVRMEKYVRTLTEKVSKGATKELDSTERRLGENLLATQEEAEKTVKDLDRTQETIQQGKNRVDQLRRQHIELSSKAAGIIESLIAIKFGDEIDKEEEKAEAKKAQAKGNGSKDPSKPKRKKTRTKRATKQPTA